MDKDSTKVPSLLHKTSLNIHMGVQNKMGQKYGWTALETLKPFRHEDEKLDIIINI